MTSRYRARRGNTSATSAMASQAGYADACAHGDLDLPGPSAKTTGASPRIDRLVAATSAPLVRLGKERHIPPPYRSARLTRAWPLSRSPTSEDGVSAAWLCASLTTEVVEVDHEQASAGRSRAHRNELARRGPSWRRVSRPVRRRSRPDREGVPTPSLAARRTRARSRRVRWFLAVHGASVIRPRRDGMA
jgi:hypothetical protein